VIIPRYLTIQIRMALDVSLPYDEMFVFDRYADLKRMDWLASLRVAKR
jgi:hypothetical protein